MYQGKSLRLARLDNGLVELCFDRQGESVNKFDEQTLGELREAVAKLRAESGVTGLLVTSAKDVFIVGADIFEFTALFALPAEKLEAWANTANEVFHGLAELPFPSVTAVNGFALGGGLEAVLATDYAVMSAKAAIGLPEIKLGILPGFGGTARLSRLIGPEAALGWMLGGNPNPADAALKAGAVDSVVAPELLRDAALSRLKKAVADPAGWKSRRAKRSGPIGLAADAAKGVFDAARAQVAKTNPRVPAASAIIDLVAEGAGGDVHAAQRIESRYFSRVAKTQAADALVGVFISDQLLKKKAKQAGKIGRPLKKTAVLGAGIMGGGIAYQSALRGTPIVMKDVAQKALETGMNEAKKLLARQVESGRMKQEKSDAILASIRPTLSYDGIGDVDAVIEAVVENMEVKRKVLAELEGLVRDDTVIATNTSSLSVDGMASVLKRPQNFVGMHFFNPVDRMPLVEVVRGKASSPEAVATIVGYAAAMGKSPIVVTDCPGFLVNRILTPYMLGFFMLLRDGGSFTEIDRVMEAFGWPMGPAFLNDVVGMDTGKHVFEVISNGYPARMKQSFRNAVEAMVEKNRLGQKNGVGFYKYEPDAKGRPKKTADPEAEAIVASVRRAPPKTFGDNEIVERIMLPMILEAAHCLDEGVAESPGDCDMALMLGLGMPQFVGGALKYADHLGLQNVVAACERYLALGPLYAPPRSLRERGAKDGKFYA